MLPLSGRVKVLDLIRKEKKLYAETAYKISGKNKSPILEIVKKEKKFVLVLLSHLKVQKLRPQGLISAQLRRKRH